MTYSRRPWRGVLWVALVCGLSPQARPDALYGEQYRPQYHFSPPQQWMNDPNGLVYYAGEYHLFYQFNPYATRWGPMHWGHAVSTDLLHWDNLPIALFPDRLGTIFSGSVVLDAHDSAGFGTAGSAPLVAIFTYDDQLRENLGATDTQSQGAAYSVDHGRTWTKFAGNPVLANPGQRDFRDPKVSWSAAGQQWIMTLAVHDHVAFYSSQDLKHWSHESDFGAEIGGHKGVWECPDLIDLGVAGGRGRKAVLLVSTNPGGPNGGSATQYFIGSFDGHKFEAERPAKAGEEAALWLDYGTDDYAGSTWSGAKPGDARQLFIGWMSNWQYANVVPTQRWRSAMTIPRELTLVDTPRGVELRSNPAAEVAALRNGGTAIRAQSVARPVDLTAAIGSKSGLLELLLDLDTRRARKVELVFSNEQGQQTTLRINKGEHRYEVDRSASGAVDFNPAFAALQIAPFKGPLARISIHALVDRASLEIFINQGETVFTTIDFPSTPYDKVSVGADQDINLSSGSVYELKSVWPR